MTFGRHHYSFDHLEGPRVKFAKGEIVYIKGDPGDCAYVVASGAVAIREAGRVIETIEPGEMFGEMAVIDSESRSASAVATGAVELIDDVVEKTVRPKAAPRDIDRESGLVG